MELIAKINKDKFPKRWIKIFQGPLGLTHRECDIAAYMIEIEYNIPWDMDNKVRSKIDKQVRDYCNLTDQDYANYKQKLKKKGFLVKDTKGGMKINPYVYKGEKTITFKFDIL